MKRFYRILKVILKNLVVFIICGLLSFSFILITSHKSLIGLINNKDASLGVVALIPVLLVYFIVFGFGGGILGLIVYNIAKFFRQRRSRGYM